MNKIGYVERCAVYSDALDVFGGDTQLIVAVEELSECQKEICKVLRGDGDLEHLAEEVADATIMLEQVRIMFDINDSTCRHMDAKIERLKKRIEARNG